MRRKVLLLGFIVLLLVGIPATLFILQRQQTITSRAQKATVLTFTPGTVSHAPGETFTTDLMVNPGTNLVSFIKVDITYDAAQLEVSGANAFVKNAGAFPQTLEGPIATPGRIAATLSIGSDPTNAIGADPNNAVTKVATITFKVKDDATGGPTNITINSNTQVLSIGSGDQASENVLLSSDPMVVTVAGASAPTATPTTAAANPTATTAPVAPTLTRTPTPSPTTPIGGANPTSTPTPTQASTQPSNTPTPGQGSNPTATPTATQLAQALTLTPTRTGLLNANQNATPTLAPTGPNDVIIGVGAFLSLIVLIGGYLFFSL